MAANRIATVSRCTKGESGGNKIDLKSGKYGVGFVNKWSYCEPNLGIRSEKPGNYLNKQNTSLFHVFIFGFFF